MEVMIEPPFSKKLSSIFIQGTFKFVFSPFSCSSSDLVEVFGTTCNKSCLVQYFQVYATNLVYCVSLA